MLVGQLVTGLVRLSMKGSNVFVCWYLRCNRELCLTNNFGKCCVLNSCYARFSSYFKFKVFPLLKRAAVKVNP
jgi:hypothetical protein